MDLREVPPIDGSSFFVVKGLKANLGKKITLPDFSELLSEESLCAVDMTVHEAGIDLCIDVHKPFAGAFLPDVEKGDGFELFLDTRGISGAKSIHKFCHQFVFIPKEVDGVTAAEITRFRLDEKRDLADPSSFFVQSTLGKKGYKMEVQITDKALHGFDPTTYPKMRIAYIAYGGKDRTLHFPHSSIDYKLRSCPDLWAPLAIEGV